jgi:hypothetical protein
LLTRNESGSFKIEIMRKEIAIKLLLPIFIVSFHFSVGQTTSASTVVKKGTKYDTIIRKHVDKPVVKPATKPAAPAPVVLPVPEFVNQPCYYEKNGNKLIKLENSSAELVTKKKTLGLKGSKEFFSMDGVSSKVRFDTNDKDSIVFFIKTSGDVIDMTSYIKLYKFIDEDQKRIVTVSSKEGMLNNNEEEKGKQINFSVRSISNDNYMIQFASPLAAGEYGFIWVKNMDMKEFTVYAFGIDWKSSN